jgi:hypothetical protein
MNQSISDESWGIENVAIRAANDSNLFNSSRPGGALVNSMPRFRDSTSAVGLNVSWSDNSASSGGIHVADLNNDGLQDFIIGAGSSAYRVITSSPSTGVYAMSSVAFASGYVARYGTILDYDRDGYMDYYGYDLNGNTGSFYRGAASLGASWSAVTPSGLSGIGSRRSAAALDLNADGVTDLAFFDGWNPVWAALNQTPTSGSAPLTPTFTLNTTTLPQSGGWGYFCSTADINNNGRFGLFYSLSTGKLWSSDASGTYTASTRGINFSTGSGAYCSAWADFNNDGWPDLLITAQYWNAPALYRNPGNTTGNFVDVNNASAASAAGLPYANIAAPNVQRGVAWGDYDNDGYLDLYICSTTGGRLYHNNGDGTFTLATEACAAYGDVADAVFVDYDNDGDLDLVVTMASGGATRVFENLSNLVTPNTNYLKVRVVAKDTAGNFTIQDTRARVELWNAAGTTLLQRRDIANERGIGTEPFWAHFGGVNPASTYTVKVFYPGGSATQTVVPGAASTTIGSRTIAQMLTVQISPSRPKIASWTETNPN